MLYSEPLSVFPNSNIQLLQLSNERKMMNLRVLNVARRWLSTDSPLEICGLLNSRLGSYELQYANWTIVDVGLYTDSDCFVFKTKIQVEVELGRSCSALVVRVRCGRYWLLFGVVHSRVRTLHAP